MSIEAAGHAGSVTREWVGQDGADWRGSGPFGIIPVIFRGLIASGMVELRSMFIRALKH
jgi:hypothetical protein